MGYLIVFLGGGVGAAMRHGVNLATARLFGTAFPFGTLTVNVVGSFLMGALVIVLERRGASHLMPLITTGFLGGFTTFSAFSLDTVSLIEGGRTGAALLYIAASVLVSLAALAAGLAAARALVAVP